jgi:Carboxypeptidase regulatory-like domain
MRKLSLVAGSIGAMAMAAVIGACSEDPVSRLPNRPTPLAFAGIEISGPDRIPPGQSAQFTAIIRLSDGTKKAASAATNVQWTTSDGQLLRVDGSGLVTTQQQLGDATLRARTGVFQSAKEVTILPDGTFRIVGLVRDAELPAIPIFGARIEVTPGQLATVTSFDGRYTLYGVPAEAEVRVTRDGYQPSVQNLRLTANATQDFELVPSGPRTPWSGSFTLAVDVTGTCSSLAPDLQHRRYEVTITQTGSDLEVTLTEPRFRLNSLSRGNKFSGRADASGATFTLLAYDYYYYYYYGPYGYPNVAEKLPNGTVLEIEGKVSMSGTAASRSGQLLPYGGIFNWDSGFPTNPRWLGGCSNQSVIVLTLTPR